MSIIKVLKTTVVWGWSPILITIFALLGRIYEWETWFLATAIGVTLLAGLIIMIVSASERQLESIAVRLRQQAGYFSRRFTGTSSLSIFAIIDTLFNMDDPQLWDWARSCDMCARLIDTWFDSFIHRVESDTHTGRFSIYLRVYLNELWILNNHYYEFVEQFYQIAEKVDIPPATKDHYNRFAVEYNTFVQNLRETVADLRNVTGTEIEPPSIKMANELSGATPVRPTQE